MTEITKEDNARFMQSMCKRANDNLQQMLPGTNLEFFYPQNTRVMMVREKAVPPAAIAINGEK